MQKLTLVVVMAALGLGGWQALESSHLRDDLEAARRETAELRADLDRIADTLEGRSASLAELPSSHDAPRSAGDGAAPPARLAPVGASPEVIARAVRDLEDRVASVEDLEEKVEGLEEKVENRPASQFRTSTFIHDVTSATRVLDLSPRQRTDLERVVEDTKRQLKELHDIPNEEGKTYREVSRVKLTGGEGMQFALPNFGAIKKFRQGLVPGSSETFGEAEERIRGRGKQEARGLLTNDQQKTWDRSRADTLFGPSRGSSVFSMVVAGESSEED